MLKNKMVRKLFLTVFCILAGAIFARAESCSTAGQIQYKPSGTCSTTQRTCCATTGAWSTWGLPCPTCSSDQCWNGSKCVDREAVSRSCSGNLANATGGTQTRTATCTNGSGWTYGSWTGACTCASNYEWEGSYCFRIPPEVTLYDCQIVPTTRENVIWIGGSPKNTTESVMATVRYTIDCNFDGVNNTYSGHVNLTFTSGQMNAVELSVDGDCPLSAHNNVQTCSLMLAGTTWL